MHHNPHHKPCVSAVNSLRQQSIIGLLLLWTFSGCVGSSNQVETDAQSAGREKSHASDPLIEKPTQVVGEPANDAKIAGEIRVLFIGNSHSSPIPKLLTGIFTRQRPGTKTLIRTAPSFGFLADHAKVQATLDLIRSGQWDIVVLQAQKYSTSGKYTYPTDGAMQLSKIATESGARVLMFPEWSRADVPDEYLRIKTLHHSIAEKTGAWVAPIGEAWEAAASLTDRKKLYAADGNHASPSGSFLIACVFYSLITNESPVRDKDSRSNAFPESYRVLEQAAWSAFEARKND